MATRNRDELWQEFCREVMAECRASNKSCMIIEQPEWGEDDDAEDEEHQPTDLTLEDLNGLAKIFLPEDFETNILDKLIDDMGWIGCDDDVCYGNVSSGAWKSEIRLRDTYSSYEGHAVLEKYCRKIKRLVEKRKMEKAFLWAFATTYVAKDDEFWFRDTNVPKKVEKIVKTLYESWQTILQNRNEELGITASDRVCVMYLLRELKDDLDDWEYMVPDFPD